MAHCTLELRDVSFTYESSSSWVFLDLTLRLDEGWTAVVGPNGAGKTTLLRLAAGSLDPDRGEVDRPGRAVYCAQRTDDPPDELALFLDADDRRAHTLRGRLRVDEETLVRWTTLSHGERKRAQIAVALWRDPAVLLLDEPTNHVDREGRQLLTGALRQYRGVGLLVSHDRELMEALCDRTLFVESPGAQLRAGSYSAAAAERARDEEGVRREVAKGRREVRRLEAEARRRKQKAEQLSRGLSMRKVDPKDHSEKDRIGRARYTGVDGKAMRRAHQLDGRRGQVEEHLDGLEAKRERKLGITQPGGRSRRSCLLDLAAGHIPMPGGGAIAHPRLRVETDDRIGVTGPNGAGKTTLIRHVLETIDIEEKRLVHLPQELTAEDGSRIASAVRDLPRERRGEVITVVSRLGSDPGRVLETSRPSPGELRKLLLALGMSRAPWLIVMDEPTNHLDLPSVECLEKALAGFPGALLLVSHDFSFLSRVAHVRWDLTPTGEGTELTRSEGF